MRSKSHTVHYGGVSEHCLMSRLMHNESFKSPVFHAINGITSDNQTHIKQKKLQQKVWDMSGVDVHPSNTWFLRPTRVHNSTSKQHLDWFSRFCMVHNHDPAPQDLFPHLRICDNGTWRVTNWIIIIIIMTDRQTDHLTPSVTIGCIYVRSTVTWPKNTHKTKPDTSKLALVEKIANKN